MYKVNITAAIMCNLMYVCAVTVEYSSEISVYNI